MGRFEEKRKNRTLEIKDKGIDIQSSTVGSNCKLITSKESKVK